MQLNNLKTFITIVEYKNISKAANILFVSQSALSQQIKQMEKELGFNLIVHSRKSEITLTSYGQLFYDFAIKTIKDYDDFKHQCHLIQNDDYIHIRFGSDKRDNPNLPRETIYQYTKNNPNIKLDVHSITQEYLYQELYKDKVDIIYCPQPERLTPEYTFHKLKDDFFIGVVMPKHPLANKEVLTLEDLTMYRIALPKFRQYKAWNEFKQEVLEFNPSADIINYTSLVFPSYENRECIQITQGSYLPNYTRMKAIPIQTKTKLTMGFISNNKYPDELDSFIKLNQKLDKEKR